ncbi:MAG: PD-(D/E)XK nuclease family protein [bacterium]
MTSPIVEPIFAASGESHWEAMLLRVARVVRDDLWNPPCWIVCDVRHREAAEIGLLNALQRSALPLNCVYTLSALAAEILERPPRYSVVNPSIVPFILKKVLLQKGDKDFLPSSNTPGFAESFWNALQQMDANGYFPDQIIPAAAKPEPKPILRELQVGFHRELQQYGLSTPGSFLLQAIKKLQDPQCTFWCESSALFLGPFLHLSVLELSFIRELARRVGTVIDASDQMVGKTSSDLWQSPERVIMHSVAAETILIRPLTPEAELDAIFAIIARWAAAGKYHYRDFRVIHPQVREVLPLIRSAAQRYCVPIRGRIPESLIHFPGAVQLLKLLDLFTTRWEREEILGLLRSRLITAPISQISAAILEILQRTGTREERSRAEFWIELALKKGAEGVAAGLTELRDLDKSCPAICNGSEFIGWIAECVRWIKRKQKTELGSAVDKLPAHSDAASGWTALETLVDDMTLFSGEKLPRQEYVEIFLRSLRLRSSIPVEQRADVVEICSGRGEDHLPVPAVIFAGLNADFPAPDRPTPFMAGEEPSSYGLQLRQFTILSKNARSHLILSCPQYSDEGDEIAPSPFLDGISESPAAQNLLSEATSWYPLFRSGAVVNTPPLAAGMKPLQQVQRSHSLQVLNQLNRRWSVSQLNNALQCPFLHFTADILRIRPVMDSVKEAISSLITGQIAHEALEQLLKGDLTEADLADWIKTKVYHHFSFLYPHPENDRAIAELTHHLRLFCQQGWLQLAEDIFTRTPEVRFGRESEYRIDMVSATPRTILLEGRIDRLDATADGRVLIIEYKYKKRDNTSEKGFHSDLQAGWLPQLPLYWKVVLEHLGKAPQLALQIFLRSGRAFGFGLPQDIILNDRLRDRIKIQPYTLEELETVIQNAVNVLNRCADNVARGFIQPDPRDDDLCGPGSCAYADLCRYRQRQP